MQKNLLSRKWLAVGIILLFVGTCIIPAIAQNVEKLQSTSRGNWLYVGGSGPGNYSNIQDAIDNASNGDTVFVYSGVYIQIQGKKIFILLGKSIHLIGENKNTTILRGNASSEEVRVYADNVEISGFTIININAVSNAGIYVSDIRYERRQNVTIHDCMVMNLSMGISLFVIK